MKKLLLLLIIPFLSFGQCSDIETEIENKGVDGKNYVYRSNHSFGLDHHHSICYCDTKSSIKILRYVDNMLPGTSNSFVYDRLHLSLRLYESESVDFNVVYKGVVFYFKNNKSFELQVLGDSIIRNDAEENIENNKRYKKRGLDDLVREIKRSDYKKYSPFLTIPIKSYEGNDELDTAQFYLNLLTKNLITKIVINGYDMAEKPMENIYTNIEINVNKKSAKKLRKQINCVLKQ